MKKIILLYSLTNDTWISLEEARESIESYWQEYAAKTKAQLVKIDIEQIETKNIFKECINADLLVIASFNQKICETFLNLKQKYNLDIPSAWYPYHLASQALAPLNHYKILPLLTEADFLIVNCNGDVKILKSNFHNLKVLKEPFYLSPNLPTKIESREEKTFIYIGRISEQKNLHTLLWSFSELEDEETELILYGTEDHHGSPNMGKASTPYLKELKLLAEKLSISERVHFKGFVDRSEIERTHINNNFIFISPSLHADENFGLAAYRTLLQGKRAVLSAFGGHLELMHYFPEQVTPCLVFSSDNGPFLEALELKKAMKSALKNKYKAKSFKKMNPNFIELGKILNSNGSNKIQISDYAQKIFSQYEYFYNYQKELHAKNLLLLNETNRGKQLFKDYSDPLSFDLYKAYGMKESHLSLPEKYQIAPWILEEDTIIKVHDLHKGDFQIKNDTAAIKTLFQLGHVSRIVE